MTFDKIVGENKLITKLSRYVMFNKWAAVFYQV